MEASWNEILGVNVMSCVFCAKAAVPLMRRDKGGASVDVASVRSIVSDGGNLQYDTTKTAIAGLTQELAADHSSEGIRLKAVGPDTDGRGRWQKRRAETHTPVDLARVDSILTSAMQVKDEDGKTPARH